MQWNYFNWLTLWYKLIVWCLYETVTSNAAWELNKIAIGFVIRYDLINYNAGLLISWTGNPISIVCMTCYNHFRLYQLFLAHYWSELGLSRFLLHIYPSLFLHVWTLIPQYQISQFQNSKRDLLRVSKLSVVLEWVNFSAFISDAWRELYSQEMIISKEWNQTTTQPSIRKQCFECNFWGILIEPAWLFSVKISRQGDKNI